MLVFLFDNFFFLSFSSIFLAQLLAAASGTENQNKFRLKIFLSNIGSWSVFFFLYNYFSTCYGVDQLAARKVMRVDQLDARKKPVGETSDLRKKI